MRDDIAELNPVQLESAPCGCERWEIDSATATGARARGITAMHVDNCPRTPAYKPKGAQAKALARKASA